MTLRQTDNPYGYRELLVFKKAEELQKACAEYTATFPPFSHSSRSQTLSALADQMDRSTRSVKQNIVEGWKRNSTKEYYDFLGFSIGANAELEEDCNDIINGIYEMGGKGITGERGFDIKRVESLPFYPLDPRLPLLVQLKLRCKELNMLFHKLQQSLLGKQTDEHRLTLADNLNRAQRQERKNDEWLRNEREKWEKGEKGKSHSSLSLLFLPFLFLSLVALSPFPPLSTPSPLLPTSTAEAATVHQGNNSGLIGYWSFNEGTSTVAHDFSGHGNNGNLLPGIPGVTQPAWVSGRSGTGLSFNGSSNIVQAANTSVLDISTGSFSASVWFKSTLSQNGSIINKKQDGATAHAGWMLDFRLSNGNTLQFYTSDGTTQTVIGPSLTTVTDGAWHQAVAVVDRTGTTQYLYVDGVLKASASIAGVGSFTNARAFSVGSNSGGGVLNSPFNGSIDEVRVYNRALSQTEITGLYWSGLLKINTSNAGGKGSLSSGLVGYWPLDGATTNWRTNTTSDLSGQGNTGSLVSMSTTTSPTTGKIGQALRFDGSASYISVPTISIPTDITVSAWVYSSNFSQNAIIVEKEPVNTQWEIRFETGALRWLPSSGSGLTTVLPSNNRWHHIVATQTGTAAKIYVDGSLSSAGVVTAIGNGAGFINIGRFNTNWYFNGTIDDVRIYNRALTAAEIKQLYLQGGGAAVNTSGQNLDNGSTLGSGLVGYWTFDGSKTQSTIADSSSSNNNGYIGVPGPATSTMKVAGKFGQALQFDGSTAFINFPSNVLYSPGAGDFSISLWVNMGKASNDLVNTSNGNVSTFTVGYGLMTRNPSSCGALAGTHLTFNMANGTSRDTCLDSVGTIPTGKWTHVVVTVSRLNTISMYINGQFDTSEPTALTGSITNAFGRIGKSTWTAYYKGIIDDVRIYNRALTAAEVKQLYNMGK